MFERVQHLLAPDTLLWLLTTSACVMIGTDHADLAIWCLILAVTVAGIRGDRRVAALTQQLAALEAQLRNQRPVNLPVRNQAPAEHK